MQAGMLTVQAFLDNMTAFMGPGCNSEYSLPGGSLENLIITVVDNDPVARAAVLLCSCTAIRSSQQASLQCAALYRLRGYAIQCIQDAVASSDRCQSDSTAIAIAALAIFELLLGDLAAREMHMRGLASIKAARGGSLGLVADRVICWMEGLGMTQIMRDTSVVLAQPHTGT